MKTAEVPMTNGKYIATYDGNIWSNGSFNGCNHKGKFLNKKQDKDGYFVITRIKKTDGTYHTNRVGRLVLQSFCAMENNKMQVNHKDGNRKNDCVENLEWVTCSENIRHSFVELNKNQKGSKNNFFKAWGIIYKNGEEEIFKDKSVDEWCLENNIASSTIYTSMREERVLKRGRFKGYRFFRFGSTDK